MATVNVLVVEDNLADQRLISEAFKKGNGRCNPIIVSDGLAAIDFLYKREKHRNCPRPQIIILDLNLPGMNGRDVLQAIKTDPSLKTIPVIMFSTSTARDDIAKAYDLHVNAYIVKPAELDQFFAAVWAIERFWCSVANLPGSD